MDSLIDKSKTQVISCSGIKVDSAGKVLVARKYDTDEQGLDMLRFNHAGASLTWNVADNTLGLVMSRIMTNSHQGAVAIVLDGKDMSVVANRGQTAGHSWANSVHVAKDGKFLGADIGDNFPRGIVVYEFSKTSKKKGKVVYSMKTAHCSERFAVDGCHGMKGVKEYTEISTPTKKYYTQSNDNRVRGTHTD